MAPDGYDIKDNPFPGMFENLRADCLKIVKRKPDSYGFNTLLVRGVPAIGKTYTINAAVRDPALKLRVTEVRPDATSFEKMLREHSAPYDVLILDDVDSVWHSEPCLNQLKKATDPIPIRRIPARRPKDKPFIFRGSIFMSSNKLEEPMWESFAPNLHVHIQAIVSRITLHHVITGSRAEGYHYACWLATEGEMRRTLARLVGEDGKGLGQEAIQWVLDFVNEHFAALPVIGPRTLLEYMNIMAQFGWRSGDGRRKLLSLVKKTRPSLAKAEPAPGRWIYETNNALKRRLENSKNTA